MISLHNQALRPESSSEPFRARAGAARPSGRAGYYVAARAPWLLVIGAVLVDFAA